VDPLAIPALRYHDEVASALRDGRAVVALETTIVVHGLPAPTNLEVAAQCEAAVRESGAVPATIGVLDGVAVVGLGRAELERLADPQRHAAKLSARDLGFAIGRGADGATTVAATVAVARRAGLDVMATGGLGGVHRDAAATFDESADLTTLSRTSMVVVASGVKSILDVGATLERLDSLGVAVVGYATDRFPGFYLTDSGHPLDWSLDTPDEVAAAFLAHREFSPTAMLLANPVDVSRQLDPELHATALAAAFDKARELGARGRDVTPVLLAEFARVTRGASVDVNRDLVVANARVAGQVAAALAAQQSAR
jgi:pseudouridylate synthase